MVANIIAFLHTTTAYQTAVLQLMVGQANVVASQLDLKEPLPIVVPVDTNQWSILPPPFGVGGSISTSNYWFEFSKGRLVYLSKRDWLKKISPPVAGTSELTNRASLIDASGAYQLATQCLASLSVNVSELEKKYPVHIKQSVIRRQMPTERPDEFVLTETPLPIFEIGWGNKPTLIWE